MTFDMKNDYALWRKDQLDVLTGLRGRQVWLLFSGGKDSSLALYFLHAASQEFGFTFDVHVGVFPKHRYTPSEIDRIDVFWKDRGVKLQWHDVETSDNSLAEAGHPCITCQGIRKRHLYEHIGSRFVDLNKLVLVTAYTLSDLVSYSLEYLMGVAYTHHAGENVPSGRTRFIETGHRFYPIVTMQSGLRIYRPVLRYNNKEVVRIIQEASIPILSVPCRYAEFRPKRILETYYESMQLHFDYDRVVTFAEECLGLISMSEYASMSEKHFLNRIF